MISRYSCLDAPATSVKCRTGDEKESSLKVATTGVRVNTSKVSATNLPQEYQLARLVADVNNLHKSWSTETPACEWHGVECNEDEEVIYITWEVAHMSGSLRFMYLPRTLESFLVYNNNLSGSVPLDQLPSGLEELSLSHNRFEGGIDLTLLPPVTKELYLGRNHFTGSVCLSNLPVSLTGLYIQDNQLTESIDLTSLPRNMVMMNVARNRFSGRLRLDQLPSKIRTIDLSDNLFSGPVDLTHLPANMGDLMLCNNIGLHGVVQRLSLPPKLQEFWLHIQNTKITICDVE